jgi:hypothetical protein
VIEEPRTAEGLVRAMRTGLLVIAALGVGGTAVELATIRHWGSAAQLIPWVCLLVLGAAIASVAFRPSAGRVRAARWVAVVALLAGLFGVFEHVKENLHAGPLDAHYAATWSSMTTVAKWWAAAYGGVGPSPTLAPAILAQISLCLLLATLGHPALRAGRDDAGVEAPPDVDRATTPTGGR